jgi:hypothetical protein
MSVALTTLTGLLTAAVTARGGVPSTAQYEQAVKDAVADYSRLRPMQKVATLTIVSGTASYSLPSDFLSVIVLESPATADGVLISDAGIVPVGSAWRELYTIAGLTISFYPTPTYGMDRDLWYAAAHVLSGGSYASMTDADAAIIMLKARALALGLQAGSMAGDILSYQIGDERVDKGKTVDALRGQVQGLDAEYRAAIAAAIGPVGRRGGTTPPFESVW